LISGFWQYFFTKPRLNILIVGLDYAGKTTLLEKIKGKYGHLPSIPPEKIPPTVGMNLARIHHRGSAMILWDLGGQLKMRNIWEKYYDDANAIIFVVDSADRLRLDEAKLAFEAVCDNNETALTPVLILANKQDLPNAVSPNELAMHFYAVPQYAERSRIFAVSALTG